MERKIFGLFFLIILYTLTYGASITVTSPKTGDIWCINQTCPITWTKSGEMDENVRIRLLNHPAMDVALAIVNPTPNDESYSWTIPATVAPGSYRMRVRTTDGAVWGDGEVFEIKECEIPLTPPSHVKSMPDLAIGFFQIFPKGTWMVVTHPIDCRLIVTNRGSRKSRGCQGNLEVIGPRGFQTRNYTLAIPQLDPGRSEEIQKIYKVWKHGIYKNSITLDSDNKNIESDEDNNEKSVHFMVNPLADLIVCLPANRSVRRFVKKKIWASVKNIGFKQSSPCKLFWKVSGNWAKYINIPRLDPGEVKVIYRHVKFKGVSRTGYIFAHIDAKFDVREMNEGIKNKVSVTWRVYDLGGVIGGVNTPRKTECSNYLRIK